MSSGQLYNTQLKQKARSHKQIEYSYDYISDVVSLSMDEFTIFL